VKNDGKSFDYLLQSLPSDGILTPDIPVQPARISGVLFIETFALWELSGNCRKEGKEL